MPRSYEVTTYPKFGLIGHIIKAIRQLLTGHLHVKYRKMPFWQRLITHKRCIFLFVDILCFFIIFSSPKGHRVTRERVHMFPKKIWGQRPFRGHWSLNFNNQDMHYWLLHHHKALYSLQMY